MNKRKRDDIELVAKIESATDLKKPATKKTKTTQKCRLSESVF